MLIAIFAVISVFLLLILKSCSNRTVEERYSISLIGKDSVSMYVGDIYMLILVICLLIR